ncbi:hypothetical protein [Nodosilinea nodulosa]|uniref:hypothetical protein n=1 Tax=Nodosilinea nodulosa TaxID=416001 RepID=UPI000375BEC6|nr:hypothetical protein [Nodosilinea nodulosa]
MRSQDAVWQGCFGNWQPLFIGEYWLPIGHAAWQGFVEHGRGMVVGEVAGVTAAVDWRCTAVSYTLCFAAQAELANCWRRQGLAAEQWPLLEEAVAAYDPAQDVILLLVGDSPPYITYLKGWAVPPPECFRQMGARQAEFNLAPAP